MVREIEVVVDVRRVNGEGTTKEKGNDIGIRL